MFQMKLPVGYIIAFGTETYIVVNRKGAKLPCNGGWLRREDYPELYAVLSYLPQSRWQRFKYWAARRTPPRKCAYGENKQSFRLPDLYAKLTTTGE